MNDPDPNSTHVDRLAVSVAGVVQGVGFRPFVYNTARSLGLTGWVTNRSDAVRIELQGDSDLLDTFIDRLEAGHPPQARIDRLDVDHRSTEPDETQFIIRSSEGDGAPRPTIPADLATCADCLAEIRDARERRFGYAFTNCTNCGPRWSIVDGLPYDRPRTSMRSFPLCDDCRSEYEDPTDRRFHAQPIACPKCGPKLTLLRRGRETRAERNLDGETRAERCVAAAADHVLAGRVLALKGLGGFQLIVDATNASAVALLRARKHRPDKPLAIMAATLSEARRYCHVSPDEAAALTAHEAPILLLRRRDDVPPGAGRPIARDVAPGNPYLGVMLPYTPLHHLLIAAIGRPVVCTSGNLSDEPMAVETDEALDRLGPIADVFLTHDRPIARPVDDSVARVGPDGLQLLRRARGYSPLPIPLDAKGPTVLALGGHLKNTVAMNVGSQAVVGAHVGDLDNPASVEVHSRAVADLVGFFDARVAAVACDLHPDYASTVHARQLAARWGVPIVSVQHHHAHVAACMAEHRVAGPVLGLSWDGTGLGTDGTIWGGEALRCEAARFERVAHLRQFKLPGGDRAAREPRRCALGLLFAIEPDRAGTIVGHLFEPAEWGPLTTMLARDVRCPTTSSMGRLFDAVAALCGLPARISFEGQAAMALEFAADPLEPDAYPMPLIERDGPDGERAPAIIDWEPMIERIIEDRAAGVPIGTLSARFHNGLADAAAAIFVRSGLRSVVLTGGCFQNALLSDQVRSRLIDNGATVFTHRQVPPGDGGIALGQLYLALQQTKE